jgi:3-hydroxyisobutyrate dehydrogenase-like beta-hydroxyacid dehydrogenase
MGPAERPRGCGDLRAAGTVAFVGCRRMGAPMARRLLAAGARVAAYDVDEHVALLLADAGIEHEPRPTTGRT